MRELASIVDLIETVFRSKENEWIYTNIDAWNKQPKNTKFWLISESEVDELDDSEIYESDDGPLLPLSLQPENLSPWMLLDTIRGVLLNLCIDKYTTIDINITDLVIRGVNYYREHDNFLDKLK